MSEKKYTRRALVVFRSMGCTDIRVSYNGKRHTKVEFVLPNGRKAHTVLASSPTNPDQALHSVRREILRMLAQQ